MTHAADLVAHPRRLITEHQSRPGTASSDAYVRSPARPFPAPLRHLNPAAPDPRLSTVAGAFAQLQEGRNAADYDLSTAIEVRYAAELVRLAETALADFDAIQTLPETTVFLAALLLADRWTRRG